MLLHENEERAAKASAAEEVEEQWKTNTKKRRRIGEKEPLPGVKLRKSSSTSQRPVSGKPAEDGSPTVEPDSKEASTKPRVAEENYAAAAANAATEQAAGSGAKSPARSSSSPGPTSAGALLSLNYSSDDDGK